MRKFAQEYVLNGAFNVYDTADLIYGFETDVTDIMNTGDFSKGHDLDSSRIVTPIFNDQISEISEATFGIYSGSNS